MLSQDLLVNDQHNCRQTHCYSYAEKPSGKDCSIRDCHVVVLKLPQQLEEKLSKCHKVNLGNARWLSKCFPDGQGVATCGKIEEGFSSRATDNGKTGASDTVSYKVQMTAVGVDSEDIFKQLNPEDDNRTSLSKQKMTPESFEIPGGGGDDDDDGVVSNNKTSKQKFKNDGCRESVKKTESFDRDVCGAVGRVLQTNSRKSANSKNNLSNKPQNSKIVSNQDSTSCDSSRSKDSEHSPVGNGDPKDTKNGTVTNEPLLIDSNASLALNEKTETPESDLLQEKTGEKECNNNDCTLVVETSQLNSAPEDSETKVLKYSGETNVLSNDDNVETFNEDSSVHSNSALNVDSCSSVTSEQTKIVDCVPDTISNSGNGCLVEVDDRNFDATAAKPHNDNEEKSTSPNNDGCSGRADSQTNVPSHATYEHTIMEVSLLSSSSPLIDNEPVLSSGKSMSSSSGSTIVPRYSSASDTKDILSQVMDEVFFGDDSNEVSQDGSTMNADDLWLDKTDLFETPSFKKDTLLDVNNADVSSLANRPVVPQLPDCVSSTSSAVELTESDTDISFDKTLVEKDILDLLQELTNKVDEMSHSSCFSSAYLEQESDANDNILLEEIQNVGSTDSDFLSMRLSDCETKDESCCSSDVDKTLYFSDSDVDDVESAHNSTKETIDSIAASICDAKTEPETCLGDVLADNFTVLQSEDSHVVPSQEVSMPDAVESKCLIVSEEPVDLTINSVLSRTCEENSNCEEEGVCAAKAETTDPIDLSVKENRKINQNDETGSDREISSSPTEETSHELIKDSVCDSVSSEHISINFICDKNLSTLEKESDKVNTEINNNLIVDDLHVQDRQDETKDDGGNKSVEKSTCAKLQEQRDDQQEDVYAFSETNEEVKDFRRVLSRSSSAEEADETDKKSLWKRTHKSDQSSTSQSPSVPKRHLWGDLRQHIKEDWLKRKFSPKIQDVKSATTVQNKTEQKTNSDKNAYRDVNKAIYSIVNDAESRRSDSSSKESEGKVPKLLIAKSTCSMSSNGEQFVSKVVKDHEQNGKLSLEKFPLKISLKLIQNKKKIFKDSSKEKSSLEMPSDFQQEQNTKECVNKTETGESNSGETENSLQIQKNSQCSEEEITSSCDKKDSALPPNQEGQAKLDVPKLIPMPTSRSPSPSLLCYARIDKDNVIKSVNLEENELDKASADCDSENKHLLEGEKDLVKYFVKKVGGVTGNQWKNGKRSNNLKPISHEILEKMADELGKEFDFDDEEVASFKQSAKSILTVVETARKKKRKKSQKSWVDRKKLKTKKDKDDHSKSVPEETPSAGSDLRITCEDETKEDPYGSQLLYKEDLDDVKQENEPILSPSVASGDTEMDFSEDGDYYPNHSERLRNSLRNRRRKKNTADLEGMLTRMRSLRNRGGDEVLSVDFDNPIPLEYAKRRQKRRQENLNTPLVDEPSTKTPKWSEPVKKNKQFHGKDSLNSTQNSVDKQDCVSSSTESKPFSKKPLKGTAGKWKKKMQRTTIRSIKGIRKYKYKPAKIKEPQVVSNQANSSVVKKRFFKSRENHNVNGNSQTEENKTVQEETINISGEPVLDLSSTRDQPEPEIVACQRIEPRTETPPFQSEKDAKDCDTDTDTASECDAAVHNDDRSTGDLQTELPLDLSRKHNGDADQDLPSEVKTQDQAMTGGTSVPNDNENDEYIRDESSPLPPVPLGIMSGKPNTKNLEPRVADSTVEEAVTRDGVSTNGKTVEDTSVEMNLVDSVNEESSCDLPKITSVISLANNNTCLGSLNGTPQVSEAVAPMSAFLAVSQSSFTATTQSISGQSVPTLHPKIIPSKSPLSGGMMLPALPTSPLSASPLTPVPSYMSGKDLYNAQCEHLRKELLTLEMIARQKEKERNNIIKLKQYKQSVMRKLQIKKALLQQHQKHQNQSLPTNSIGKTDYQRHIPISPIARHAPIVVLPPSGHVGQIPSPLSLNQNSPVSGSASTPQPTIYLAPSMMSVPLQQTQGPQENDVSSTRDTPKTPTSADATSVKRSSPAVFPKDKSSSVPNLATSVNQETSKAPQPAYVFHQDWDKRLNIVPRSDFSSGLSSVETIVAKANENFGLQFQGWMEDSHGMLRPFYQRTPYASPNHRPIAPKLPSDNQSPNTTASSGSQAYFINSLAQARFNDRRAARNLDEAIRNVYSRKLSSPTVTSSLPPYMAQSSLYGTPMMGFPITNKPSDTNVKEQTSPRQQHQEQRDGLSPINCQPSKIAKLSNNKLPNIPPSSPTIKSPTGFPSNSTLAKLLLSPLPDLHSANKISKSNTTENSTTDSSINDNTSEFKEPLSPFDNKSPDKVHRWPYCRTCRSQYARFICAGCNNQWYCSELCQVKDWKHHFKSCRR